MASEGTTEYAEYAGITRWIILAAVMLGTLMQVIDTSIVNVAIPTMEGNLGVTLSEIGWVSTGYMIANVIVLPLTGWLSATFGRRKYLTFSMVLFTAASFFCGASHTLGELVFFRVVQGVGGAALISTAQATLLEIFPPQKQGLVQSIFGIGVMVGPTVGPTLGGWITDNYSWPWIFFINIPIGALASLLTYSFMHDSRHQERPEGGVDLVGIGFLAVGLGCLQTMLEEGNQEDWLESAFIQWMAVLAVAGLVAFVWWELRTRYPAVRLRVLRDRGLAAGTLFGAVYGCGLFGGNLLLPVFLQNLRGYSAQQSGMTLLPGAIATAMMVPFVGRFIGKMPARNLAMFGVVTFIGSMWSLHFLTGDTGSDTLFWPLVIRGAAMGFLWLPLTMASLAGIDRKDMASGTGLYNLSRQLGGSAGIALLSTLLDHRTAFHRAMLVENLTPANNFTLERLQTLQGALMARGSAPAIAHGQALEVLDRTVQLQSSLLAFGDCFLVVGAIFLFAFPLLFLFKAKRRERSEPAPRADAMEAMELD